MALPEKYHLDALRKLRGDASVTFPGGSTSVVRVERVQTVPRGSVLPEFLSTDEEYPTAKLVEQQILGGDANHVEVYRLWHTLPGVEVTQYTVDEETRCTVAVRTQLVEAPVEPPPAEPLVPFVPFPTVPGTQIEYQPINGVYGTKITTTINSGVAPSNRTESGMVEYHFPTLLFGIYPQASPEPWDGTARLRLVSDRRTGFAAYTQSLRTFLYGTQAALAGVLNDLFNDTFPNVYNATFNNLIYEGIAFDVNERNVLSDPFPSIIYTSGTQNPKWPYFVEEFVPLTVSVPTASEYQALIGQFAYVSGELKAWRAGWWRLELLSVKLK